ncbi:MAG: selenocysteine-specific translation elongation factor [Clostridia bacterium]|nr:selenocysteine-specific translation elongation factor [Clostridia bacterium]
MKNIVVGTSGHVDHGKTWLIKALTGMDTDRLLEEKKRGITIENGFADMICGDYNVSFIDVPGHERFVRNMLAGIGGIDLVLLVIDLVEGVMPQTREHLEILKMLGIQRGIVVFTKDDAVEDEEWKDLVEEDVKELLAGSFLADAPQIRVSAATGKNIEALKELILQVAENAEGERKSDVSYRLPIDRVFTIDGFGTVVTGTSLAGTVKTGDLLAVYPEGKTYKVRNLQVHNEFVEKAYPGQRTAINFSGAKKEELRRGQVAATPGSLTPSLMLDVELKLFDDTERVVENGSRVHFFSGASEALAKVILLGREALAAGESCFAQLRFTEEIAMKRGDRFIVRFYSPMESIGGGVILDASPRKAKRNDGELLLRMERLKNGTPRDLVEAEVAQLSSSFPDTRELADRLSFSRQETETLLAALAEKGKVKLLKGGAYVHADYFKRVAEQAEAILDEFHRQNPLMPGMKTEELKTRLGTCFRLKRPSEQERLTEIAVGAGGLTVKGDTVCRTGFTVALDAAGEALKERIRKRYREAGFDMPEVEEALAGEKDRKAARDMIALLAAEGALIKINPVYYMDSSVYEKAFAAFMNKMEEQGSVTLAEMRDLMGSSRKYTVAFLDHLDAKGITRMEGEARVLARK